MCFKCGLRALPIAEASSYAYSVPLAEVSAKNSRCKFKVLYFASPSKVNDALSPLGVKITSMDKMQALADYYDRGEATAYYKVDIAQLLDKIVVSPEEQKNIEDNFVCTY